MTGDRCCGVGIKTVYVRITQYFVTERQKTLFYPLSDNNEIAAEKNGANNPKQMEKFQCDKSYRS